MFRRYPLQYLRLYSTFQHEILIDIPKTQYIFNFYPCNALNALNVLNMEENKSNVQQGLIWKNHNMEMI